MNPPSETSLRTAPLRFWVLIFLLVSLLAFVLYHQFSFIEKNEACRIQFTPDDGYYYLTLARHFAQSAHWTFDGTNPASGFHLLWGYLLALLWWIFSPGPDTYVFLAYILELLLVIVMVSFIVSDFLRRGLGVGALLVLAVLVSAEWFRIVTVSLTEWGLVVFCTYLYFANRDKSPKVAFAVAFIGTVARADFALFVGSFLIVDLATRQDRATVNLAVSSLFGVAAGVGLVLLHSYLVTGEFIQSSVRMKFYWAEFYRSGSEKDDAISLITRTVGYDGITFNLKQKIFAVAVFLPMTISLWALRVKETRVFRDVTGAVLSLLMYELFYFSTGSMPPWWTAEIFVSLLVAWTISIEFLWNRLGIGPRLLIIALLVVAIFHNATTVANPPYRHQRYMLEAGQWLQTHREYCGVGAWNAGIIGYYAGGNVINLDGLVNATVQPYIMRKQLPEYFQSSGIHYVIDFSEMFNDKELRQRGGYDDTAFLKQFNRIKTFDTSHYAWTFLTLYEVR